jgi:hypothetical protein
MSGIIYDSERMRFGPSLLKLKGPNHIALEPVIDPDLNSKNIDTCVLNKNQTCYHLTVTAFWAVTPYGLVGRYQHFRESFCLHIQGTGVTSVLA